MTASEDVNPGIGKFSSSTAAVEPSQVQKPEASEVPLSDSPQARKQWTWRRAKLAVKRCYALVTTLSTVVVAGLILWLLGDATLPRHRLELEAIGVPKRLADDGFSSDVLTRWLRDEIERLHRKSATTMAKADAGARRDLSGVTIPGAGISVASMAASLRSFVPETWKSVNEVSGEITLAGDQLLMRLRLDGKILDERTGDLKSVASLIEGAAFKVVQKTQPYIAARVLFQDGKLDEASAAADDIIWFWARKDENVRRAWIIKGHVAERLGQYDSAEGYFKTLPKSAVARYNLGWLLGKTMRSAEAEAEFRESIRLDPNYALAHNGLGALLRDRGKLDEAEAELKKAIKLDPELALARYNMAVLLQRRGELGRAEVEYRKSARLAEAEALAPSSIDIDLAIVHYELGSMLLTQRKFSDAEAEFKRAIDLDPKLALAHYDLSILLYGQGKLASAFTHFLKAIDNDQHLALARSDFGNLNEERTRHEAKELQASSTDQFGRP